MRRIDEDALRRVPRMNRDHPLVGQYLHPAGGAADLHPAADEGERHRVAALLEADRGVDRDTARDGDVEWFRQKWRSGLSAIGVQITYTARL
jgi:hypothetical protein